MTLSITFATLTNVATLIFGVFVGFSFSILFVVGPTKEYWTRKTKVEVQTELPDTNYYDYDLSEAQLNYGNEDQDENPHALENITVANLLFEEVRILCCVFTTPKNHPKKAKHVLKTWGSRCNKVLFMSTAKDETKDEEIDLIAVPVPEDMDRRWAKTKEAFKYVYENHLNEYDWFLKVFDDTYVIMENLRYMLFPYAAESPIYFGCKYKPFVEQGYNTGHAGYVLSREAVRRFVEVGIPDKEKCRQDDHGFEDIELGRCLEKIHVFAGDSRDSVGKGRFFPFLPERHLLPKDKTIDSWYWKYIYYQTDEGLDCCSDNAISYHGVTTNQMYVFEYLIYHLRPYGIVRHPQPLPVKLPGGIYNSVDSPVTQSKNE